MRDDSIARLGENAGVELCAAPIRNQHHIYKITEWHGAVLVAKLVERVVENAISSLYSIFYQPSIAVLNEYDRVIARAAKVRKVAPRAESLRDMLAAEDGAGKSIVANKDHARNPSRASSI